MSVSFWSSSGSNQHVQFPISSFDAVSHWKKQTTGHTLLISLKSSKHPCWKNANLLTAPEKHAMEKRKKLWKQKQNNGYDSRIGSANKDGISTSISKITSLKYKFASITRCARQIPALRILKPVLVSCTEMKSRTTWWDQRNALKTCSFLTSNFRNPKYWNP